jgi:hypothetical protein
MIFYIYSAFINLILDCYIMFFYNTESTSHEWILVFVFRCDFKYIPQFIPFNIRFYFKCKIWRKNVCFRRNSPSLFTFRSKSLFEQTDTRRILVCKHRRQKRYVFPMPEFILHLEVLLVGVGDRIHMHGSHRAPFLATGLGSGLNMKWNE